MISEFKGYGKELKRSSSPGIPAVRMVNGVKAFSWREAPTPWPGGWGQRCARPEVSANVMRYIARPPFLSGCEVPGISPAGWVVRH
ncbi:hypothetical protein Q0Z83_011450 [Actinoplanes sichuanensis]|nr:hypothetical protein Q0Z83_011450 [Actinoplanes sichuanensis]